MWQYLAAFAPAVFDYFSDRQDRRSAEGLNKSNEAFQREFAQMGLRWRVADARAAGLHPLSAIGVNPPSFTPSGVVPGSDFRSMGQNISRAIAASMDQAQMELIEAQTDESRARAELLRSQALGTGRNNPGVVTPQAVQTFPYTDQVLPAPDEVVSQKSGELQRTAGTHAFWREYQWSPKLKIQLPMSDEGPGEARENLSWYDWLTWVIPYNVSYYGKDWIKGFFEEFWGADFEEGSRRFRGAGFGEPGRLPR